MATKPSAPPLHILILGAGIAGLTCALSLRQHGHTVTLLEKSHFSKETETGAAVIVGPNASGHLIKLGWDPTKSGSNACEGVVAMGMDGEVKMKRAFEKGVWKNPWLLAHRVDLHRELKRVVMEQEGAELITGVKIVEVDAQNGIVRLEDGRVFEGDVIIGADGNRSFSRHNVEEKEMTVYGKACYRWLVSKETIASDPETSQLITDQGYFMEIAGPDRKLIIYPCRDNTMLNVGAFIPSEEARISETDWQSRGSKPHLEAAFSSFSPSTRKFISHAGSDLKVWQLLDMSSLPTFHKHKLALIGDAAHPFLPFLGQGAAQAIEDAVSIGVLLGKGTRREEVEGLLGLYDEVRRGRAHYVQEATRKNGRDGEEKPPPSFMMEMLLFCYGHDEEGNSRQKLAEWKERRQTS